MVEKYGSNKWILIANAASFKNSGISESQLKDRWSNVLDPKIKKGKFTKEDYQYLIQVCLVF
jgi:hypothetical protein